MDVIIRFTEELAKSTHSDQIRKIAFQLNEGMDSLLKGNLDEGSSRLNQYYQGYQEITTAPLGLELVAITKEIKTTLISLFEGRAVDFEILRLQSKIEDFISGVQKDDP